MDQLRVQKDPWREDDDDEDDEEEEEEESTELRGVKRESSTGLKDVVNDEVAKGSTTAQDPVSRINSQNVYVPAKKFAELKEAAEILDRTSEDEKWTNIAKEVRNLLKINTEQEESTELRGAKGQTGFEVLVVNEVAEASTIDVQDPVNIINSQNELPSSQGEEPKEADEIRDRASMKEKWRNIVKEVTNLQKNDEDEEEGSTELRGGKSETGLKDVINEVAEGSTPVQDPVNLINSHSESSSSQDESNILDRTSMEEEWTKIVNEVLPGEAVVSLEAVPKEVIVQLLKVVDKSRGSVNRPETVHDEIVDETPLLFYCCLSSSCCRKN